MPRAGDLGERALVARITAKAPAGGANLLGFTDDAALLRFDGPGLVASTDSFREATHFPRGMTAEEMGAFSAEAALSDLAAMGAEPVAALLALGVPRARDVRDVDGFADGFLAALDRAGAPLVGGDLKEDVQLSAVVTVLGRIAPSLALKRSGARPADLLAVTGALGGAGAGLEALARGLDRGLAERLLAPRARLAEGRALAATRGTATAAMDASDGLAACAHEIARRSGALGVVLDAARLPLAAEALAVAGGDRARARAWALHAGGDYELVVALERTEALQAVDAVRQAGGTLTIIGHLAAPGSGAWLVDGDARAPLPDEGFEHLAAPRA